MIFISIGKNHFMKYKIDAYTEKKKQLFFDFIETDMENIIKLLNCENIENILNKENIIYDKTKIFIKTNTRIYLESLENCAFVHYIHKELNEIDLDNFIERYKKRYKIFIEIIKSNKKLFFVRYGDINENDKNMFIETILKINENCNFYLVNITLNNEKEEIYQFDNYIKITLKTKKNNESWINSYIDWKSIFDYLKSV